MCVRGRRGFRNCVRKVCSFWNVFVSFLLPSQILLESHYFFPFVEEKCLSWEAKRRLSWALWSQTALATRWLMNTWLWTTVAVIVHLLQAKSLCLTRPLRWRTCFGLSKIPTAIKKTFFCIRKQMLWRRSCCILKQQVVGRLWKTQPQELVGIWILWRNLLKKLESILLLGLGFMWIPLILLKHRPWQWSRWVLTIASVSLFYELSLGESKLERNSSKIDGI